MAREEGSGVCRFFESPNVCKVYERRPTQCRASELPEATVKRQTKVCKYLQSTEDPELEEILRIINEA